MFHVKQWGSEAASLPYSWASPSKTRPELAQNPGTALSNPFAHYHPNGERHYCLVMSAT